MDISFENILSLNPFAGVSRRLGIRLTIRGGLVRRLVRTAIHEDSALDSDDLLFRLTPFTSDIDVEHSGRKELNARVHEELVAAVPAAAAIRMEIRSEEESQIFAEARSFQAFAPVLSMSLSSDRFHDPDGGALDIAERKYRFRRNPIYRDSPLFLAERDTEIFQMLLYLKAVLEDGAEPATNYKGDLQTQRETARGLVAGYLKARLFYLLAGIWGVSHLNSDGRELLRETGLDELLCSRPSGSNVSDALSAELNPRRALIVSTWLGGKAFRFPRFLPEKETFIESEEESQSPWLALTQGISDCAVKQTSFGMEFVHLLLELPGSWKEPKEEEITARWTLKGTLRQDKDKKEELDLHVPTICHILRQEGKVKLSIRSNLLNLGSLTTAFTDVEAKVKLVFRRRKSMPEPTLLRLSGANAASDGTQHFVYVHGIRSDPSTFGKLRLYLEEEARERGVSVAHYGFKYPYRDNMETNGSALAQELSQITAEDRSVTLFGHSMGGLICRLAILNYQPAIYKRVKRVIMFGTPNHGAVRASTLMLPLLWNLHKVVALADEYWLRSPGILQLTEVHKVFEGPLRRHQQAKGIEYITIPGTCFHQSRQHLDFSGITRMMRALGVLTLLLRFAYSPRLPHDGIVERESVDLLPVDHGRRSEKEGPRTRLTDSNIEYAHMALRACVRLDHLTVHTDDDVLEFVGDLAFAAKLHNLAEQYEGDLWPFPLDK